MPSWIDLIKMEMEMEQQLFEPQTEISKIDHIVGEVDDDLKKLYCIAMQWKKAADETLPAARRINVDQDQQLAKARELYQKSEILQEIFWISLEDSFNLWHRRSIGVRKGWKVVWTELSEAPEMPETPLILNMLRNLFLFF